MPPTDHKNPNLATLLQKQRSPLSNQNATGALRTAKIDKMVKRLAQLRQTFWRDTKRVSLPEKYSKIVEKFTGKVVGENTDSFLYNFASADTALFELIK